MEVEAAECFFNDANEEEQEFVTDQTSESNPVKAKEPRKQKFVCDRCGYKTNDKYNLRIHMQGVHLKIKRFFCDCCDYKAFSKHKLRIHMVARHISKELRDRIQCPICTATFTAKSSLKVHIKSIHKKNPALYIHSHCCHVCEKPLPTPYLLQKHLDSHSKGELGTACDFLKITFLPLSDLKCQFSGCQKSYRSRKARSRHEVSTNIASLKLLFAIHFLGQHSSRQEIRLPCVQKALLYGVLSEKAHEVAH